MKVKILLLCSAVIALSISIFILFYPFGENESSEPQISREKKEKMPKLQAHVEARLRYEYDMLKDPATGKIPQNIFAEEIAFARQMPLRAVDAQRPIALNNYISAGPNNIGGRTRAAAYDVRYNGSTNRVIIAGCVSGGIMRSADGGQSWTLVTPNNDVHSFTALAQDPRAGFQDTWYAAGGEAYGNSAGDLVGASYMGYGVWKSTDNGVTWTKLTFSLTDIPGNGSSGTALEAFDHPFDFVHRLKVNPVNGHLYIACHRRVVRSTDGGNSFVAIFGSAVGANSQNGQTEVAISNDGKILLGMNGGNPDLTLRGVWISSTGSLGSFSRIAGGQTPGVDSVQGWRGNSIGQASKRIVLSFAPSDNNIAYAYYENGLSNDAPDLKPEADLFRIDIAGNAYTFSNRSANMPDFPGGNASGSDPLAVQGGYNMLVAVKPDDPNTVFISGTNLYRSTDGFSSTANTAWINGYQTNFTYALYPNGHPDVHTLAFHPTNPNEAICGDDGGIRVSTNIGSGPVSWTPFPNYQTLQYYYVAMDPDAGRNNFAGGAQDNGTNLRDALGILGNPADSNSHIRLVGGDGCAVGLSKIDVSSQNQYLYGGFQYGNIQRVRLTNSVAFANIRPNGLTPAFPGATNEFGEFVTNFRINQDNAEQLYYVNFNRLFRTTAASSVTAGGWTELTGVSSTLDPSNGTGVRIRAIAFTRGLYHPGHSIYIGTTTGKVYRLDDPANVAAGTFPTEITPPGMNGNVQNIAVNPNNDNEIIAVVSNYNVVSIWWTANAKAANPTWKNAEGNLTLPSVRSCEIIVKKDASNNPVTEYYVGTSVGLYSAVNLGTTLTNNQSPTWQREGSNMLNYAVVQHIVHRPVDNVMVIGTHGNGMFYTYLGTPNFVPTTNTAINPVTNDRRFIRNVYPTLATNELVRFETGDLTGIKKINIRLMDINGRVVYEKQDAFRNGSLPFSSLPASTYILSIQSDDNRYRHVQKIVKQK